MVSVFGEWGIGKTRCLKDIQRIFAKARDERLARVDDSGSTDPLVIPVFFDPWQYEHEEHLVVPLLKTIEYELVRLLTDGRLDSAPEAKSRGTGGSRALEALKAAAAIFGTVAVAILSGIKVKFSPLKEVTGFGVELSGKDAMEAGRSWWSRAKSLVPVSPGKSSRASLEALAQRESLYFDFKTSLEHLTTGSPEQHLSLRFVILIDDLDRCLPEKAVQMLESVKLFLNVRGFSFVLAVDDEVVERGIAHRYRDYASTAGALPSPISGAEYLEKVVHLPVLLHRWTAAEARAFLVSRWPELFDSAHLRAEPGPSRDSEASAARGRIELDARTRDTVGEAMRAEVLELVLSAAPLVPRKLIRLVEGMLFLKDQLAGTAGQGSLWDPRHGARVTALQQLYPDLHRYVRKRPGRYWRLFRIGRDPDFEQPMAMAAGVGAQRWRDIEARWTQLQSGPVESPSASENPSPRPASPAEPATSAERASLAELHGVMKLVLECDRARSGADVLAWFGNGSSLGSPRAQEPSMLREGLTQAEFRDAYFGIEFPRAAIAGAAGHGATRAPIAAPPESPAEVIALRDRLLDLDPVNRREFVETHPIAAGWPPELFDAVLGWFARQAPGAAPQLRDVAWLEDFARVSTPTQLLRLYQDCKVLELWSDFTRSAAADGDPTTRTEVPDALPTMRDHARVVELLTRAANPAHRRPRTLGLSLPAPLAAEPLHGVWLRGLQLPAEHVGRLRKTCDVVGCSARDSGLREHGPTAKQALEPIAATSAAGHGYSVNAVAFSPDGQRLASASNDDTVRLWTLDADGSARQSAVLRGHENWVMSVAFSPDGQRLASGSVDNTVRLWALDADGKARQGAVLQGHEKGVTTVVFSSDGQRLASASVDKTVRLWSLESEGSAQQSAMLQGHSDSVLSVAFSPDGRHLASASDDGTVRLWTLDPDGSAQQGAVLQGHSDSVLSVAFSPDGRRLASASNDDTVRLWTLDADGSTHQSAVLQGHEYAATSVAFSPDGQRLASSSVDNTVRLWILDPDGGARQSAALRGHDDDVNSVAFSPDGRRLASASDDDTVRLWTLDPDGSARQSAALQGASSATSVAFSPDGHGLASASDDNTVRLWTLDADGSARQTAVLHGHERWVRSLAFSPNGQRLASASDDDTVRLWTFDTDGNAPEGVVLRGHEDSVLSVAFSPDGHRLASASRDRTVRLWAVDAGGRARPSAVLEGHADNVNSVAFSPDGRRLASASDHDTVRLWILDADGGARLNGQSPVLSGASSVLSLAFSPDGQRLACVSVDNTVRLLALDSDGSVRLSAVIEGASSAMCVAFSPDGKRLASASWDETVRLWTLDTDGGARLSAVLQGHGKAVTSVAFSPDSQRLAVAARVVSVYARVEIDYETWEHVGVLAASHAMHRKPSADSWTLQRADGAAWKTESIGDEVVPADPLLHECLWFRDAAGRAFSAWDVPSAWLGWSDDYRSVRISNRKYPASELERSRSLRPSLPLDDSATR